MQRYEIEVDITLEGDVKATVKGITGKACGPLSAFLDVLGNVTHDSETAEAHQSERVMPIRQAIGQK